MLGKILVCHLLVYAIEKNEKKKKSVLFRFTIIYSFFYKYQILKWITIIFDGDFEDNYGLKLIKKIVCQQFFLK